ncbi:hypothetical protein V8F06_010236 [Rhypophila decipiens]
MSWKASYYDEQGSVRLLSLDGGGIRGLSSLIILKHLMERVDPNNPPKPCDYFQLIGGTSTGGLIAIMLGRLRMSVDECIDKYLQLSAEAFKLKRSKLNLVAKGKDFWKADGKYRSETLATEFRKAAMELEEDPDALLFTPDTSCRVFVCANSKTLNQPVLIRSYKTDSSVNYISTAKCRIWEAARATSAASTFFDPIQIGTQQFVDGATGMNNPVEMVLSEAKAIWPDDARDRIQCLISIGTGVPPMKDFGGNLAEIANTLKSLATDTQRTAERFYQNHAELGVGDGRYFRFNVDNSGLSDVRLDEQEKKEQIVAATEMYLEQGYTQSLVSDFLRARAPQDGSVPSTMKNTYLEWLPFIDTRQQHNAARSLQQSRATGRWFLDGEPFHRWSNTAHENGQGPGSTLMWLHAPAGSGKTVLTSAIIDHIERQTRGGLAFFYLSFEGKDRSSGTVDLWHFKSSLLVQILKAAILPDPRRPNDFLVPASFQRLYKKYRPSRNPTMEDLDATLWGLLASYLSAAPSKNSSRPFYIVVDGLDEYSGIAARREMVAFLADILTELPVNIHILVTSRPEPDILAAITAIKPAAPAQVITLAFDKDTINNDIKKHLSHLIKTGFDPSYDAWSDELKDQVITELTEQADGVFRWADLQVRALAGKEREKDVRKALKRLPKGLEETYERMLRRIQDADESEEAIVVLSWLACAKRPLGLAEVSELVAFEVENTDDGTSTTSSTSGDEELADDGDSLVIFDPSARYKNPDSLRRILAGLVTFTELERLLLWDEQDQPDDSRANRTVVTVVTFAHFSVKQYLQGQNPVPARFRLDPVACNRFVFRCCLAYMEHYDNAIGKGVTATSKTGSKLERSESSRPPYPLLLYTWQHTGAHALEVYSKTNQGRGTKQASGGGTVGASELVEEYFREQVRGFSLTLSARYAVFWAHTAFREKPKEQKLLFSLIKKESGLTSIVGDSTNGSCPWAIVFPCLDLLDNNDRSIAFVIAALAEPALMQLMLDVGMNAGMLADPRSQETLLHVLSSGEGYLESILRRLPAFGHDGQRLQDIPKITDGQSIAETMQKLIAGGCRLDAQDREGRIPLHSAAWAGHTSTVRYLLAHHTRADAEEIDRNGGLGVKPYERRDSMGRTPFFLAVSRGHLETCETLLESMDHPAKDMNISDNKGRTPLIEAAAMRRTSVVRSLLSRPEVNVNQKDKRGRTALLWAMWSGAKHDVDILLAHSAIDPDTVDAEGWNILICAAERGHDELVRNIVLRPDKVDINHRDLHGRTALSWAAFRGHIAVVEILMQQPHVEVDAMDHLGCSPLDWARFEGHDKVAELLINDHQHIPDPKQSTASSLDLSKTSDSPMTAWSKSGTMDVHLKQTISFPANKSWSEEVWCTSFSHDGRRVAVAGRANFVDIWDMSSGQLESTLETPAHVTRVSWSPDDSLIVTCTLHGALVWEAENACTVRLVRLKDVLGFDDYPTTSCVWAPDNKWFILGSPHPNTSLWREVLGGDGDEKADTVSLKSQWHNNNVFDRAEEMEWLVGGKTMAVAKEEQIALLEIDGRNTGRDIILESRIVGMCVSRDSRVLLAGCASGVLVLVDLVNDPMKIVARYLGTKGGEYKQFCSFGGGVMGEDFVLTGSEDGSILIWSKETTELIVRLESQHLPRCNTVAWSPIDPSLFVSGGDDFTWKIWQVRGLEASSSVASSEQDEEDHEKGWANQADLEHLKL